MTKKEEEILDKIRERVLEREKQLQLQQDKEANLEATLQALEEITEVPREEMERIAAEIKAGYGDPPKQTATLKTPLSNLPILYQRDLPATVMEAVEKLPPVLQQEFHEEYALAEKKRGLSYLFWLIPPPFSCHYFYNSRVFTQILYSLSAGGFLIWWIVDFFRIPQIVEDENRKTARKFLKKMMRQSLRRQRGHKRGHHPYLKGPSSKM